MDPVMAEWHQTQHNKHPELAIEVALWHSAYDKVGLKAPNTAVEQHITMVTTKKDTGASRFFVCK